MKKIIKVYTVFKFDELSETAKQKALEKLWDINVDNEWWECIYGDAKDIGIEITAFDIDRGNMIEIKKNHSELSIAQKIIENHGVICDTYILASKFIAAFNLLEEQQEKEYTRERQEDEGILCDDFIHNLKEEYLSTLKKEYEYQTSKEQIIESIRSNDYDFSEEGNFPAY